VLLFFSPCFFFFFFLVGFVFLLDILCVITRDKSYSSFILSLNCQSSCGVQFLESVLFDALYGFAPFVDELFFVQTYSFPNHSPPPPPFLIWKNWMREGCVRLGHVCVSCEWYEFASLNYCFDPLLVTVFFTMVSWLLYGPLWWTTLPCLFSKLSSNPPTPKKNEKSVQKQIGSNFLQHNFNHATNGFKLGKLPRPIMRSNESHLCTHKCTHTHTHTHT